MLALRSCLSHAHPLLSRLRPVRRHGGHGRDAGVLGRNLVVVGSRGLVSISDKAWGRDLQFSGHAMADGPEAATTTTKRHLYVVLDDKETGFGIHKLDVDDLFDCDARTSTETLPRRLPEPPVIRVGTPTVRERTRFAGLGSSIIAIGTSPGPGIGQRAVSGPCGENLQDDGILLIYDTKTAVQTISRALPATINGACVEAAVAVGEKMLYVFESGTEVSHKLIDRGRYYEGGMHCLTTDRGELDNIWAWRRLSPSSPWGWTEYLTNLRFPVDDITAHAVHPRGCTIFLSVAGMGTTSCSTESNKFTPCGRWMLSFVGHGHYDDELDAWVGLHLDVDAEYDNDSAMDGRICACRVTSADESGRRPPEWKVGEEKLFLEDPNWMQVDVELVRMGDRGEYCLMERLRRRRSEGEGTGADEEEECLGEGGGECVLRLTTFRVKYGEDGELVTTTAARQPARSYTVSRYQKDFPAQAFWM